MGHMFEINYKPEKDNKVAEALSYKEEMELRAIFIW